VNDASLKTDGYIFQNISSSVGRGGISDDTNCGGKYEKRNVEKLENLKEKGRKKKKRKGKFKSME
jgi:hypothetical protein